MSSVKIFWLVWVLTIVILIVSFFFQRMIYLTLFLILLVLGLGMYKFESYRKSNRGVRTVVESIDLKPIEETVKRMKEKQGDYLMRSLELEMELDKQKKELEALREMLEKLPREQELQYREVVKKVLDLENKMNERFKLLGEAVVRISKGKDE